MFLFLKTLGFQMLLPGLEDVTQTVDIDWLYPIQVKAIRLHVNLISLWISKPHFCPFQLIYNLFFGVKQFTVWSAH